MANALDNPLEDLVDTSGAGPGAVWKAAGTVAGILGAVAVRKALDRVNVKAAAIAESPDPGRRKYGWGYAVLWAGVVGIGASVGRLGAQAIVARVWKHRHPVRARV